MQSETARVAAVRTDLHACDTEMPCQGRSEEPLPPPRGPTSIMGWVGGKEEPLRKVVDGDSSMDEERPDPNVIPPRSGSNARGAPRGSGGEGPAIFRVELGGELYALRVFRPEEDGVARREAEVMRAAGEGGVPVPRVCAEGMWRDRAALLLSWCPGLPMAEELAARPWRAWPLGVLFGRCQAAIHGRPSRRRCGRRRGRGSTGRGRARRRSRLDSGGRHRVSTRWFTSTTTRST